MKIWYKTNGLLSVFAAALILVTGMVTSNSAEAQSYSNNPSFGTYQLYAGFAPDPYGVNITAGGTLAAESLGGSQCVGTIANSPDVRLIYSAGSYPLSIWVESAYDTTLVINDPYGNWWCNDDGIQGTYHPLMWWDSPPSGQYDIWVGNFDRGRGLPATIYFSEQ